MEGLGDFCLVGRTPDYHLDSHTSPNADRFWHADPDVHPPALFYSFPYANQDPASIADLHSDGDLDTLSHADEVSASILDTDFIQHIDEDSASDTIPNADRDREALRYAYEERCPAVVYNEDSDTEIVFYADKDTFPNGDRDAQTIFHVDEGAHPDGHLHAVQHSYEDAASKTILNGDRDVHSLPCSLPHADEDSLTHSLADADCDLDAVRYAEQNAHPDLYDYPNSVSHCYGHSVPDHGQGVFHEPETG